ncbi:MAG: glutamate--tRNA ligase [Candidatus Diapherotrites archaeon]|uniref:Glutamate--tRNA ligase n=1 Tax=Candidatus Iainarchaeum sp. TaxID=3101447 RepID=A0A2D6M0L9_9ARCH|nr:glutamate--tRNA ligase [Candidatus Diapherotrites archaeon]|tara:strand:- start:5806 stop:7422 length:1617 start_codon:yes stop_codon:yes gene_type:complete
MSLTEDAYRYAIKNAFLHEGKADVGAIVGKMKALHPDLDIKDSMPSIIEAVKKVNALGKKEIEAEYKKFEGSYELKPKQKDSMLPTLDWAEKESVVTRYAPNPNGPFHLGNARAAILCDEFAKIYGGKMILRFDDTDPKIKKPIENAEAIFKEDLEWLGCEISETYFASDRLDIYYKYMKEVLKKGHAYVCDCDVEKWRKLIKAKKACKCRDISPKEQLQRFEKMLSNEFKEGQAVLRIKTDLNHNDPSIRDWWAAKVVDNPVHPNPKSKGKHVWPSYNFASAIDDHELGVTLILRGQEHAQNQTKQEFLYDYFKWTYPHSFHFGRIKLADTVLSTSKIKEGIEKGEYKGWDNPRLGTIKALRRRGFQASALRKAILDVGVKSSGVSIDAKRLHDLNKEELGDVKRIGFIAEPVRLSVDYAPDGTEQFVVDSATLKKLKVGSVFRLREKYNVKITKKDPLEIFGQFVGTTNTGKEVVGWLSDSIDIELVMPDGKKMAGLASKELLEEKEGSIIQLDKFGFCRIDSVQENRVVLWFAHK